MGHSKNIVDISHFDNFDLENVGKKAFEFGKLKSLGIPIPKGFIIKTSSLEEFMKTTGISAEIEKLKKIYHPSLKDSVEKLFEPARKKILHTHFPQNLTLDLHKFYRKLAGKFKEASVDIFSSSKTNKSIFFSNIKGDANLILKIKKIWSSNLDNPVAILVTKNVKPEIKGNLFTNNYIVNKKLTPTQSEKLINYCKIIQKHFYFPKEIEYIVKNGEIFITNIKPFTETIVKTTKSAIQNNKQRKILAKGISVNPGIITGRVRILDDKNDFKIKKGEIVILPNLNKITFRELGNANAIIVDSILPNSVGKAIFRKRFNFPAIEGAKDATKIFQNGNVVTVNGMNGEIYSGGIIY